jgi:hypothetical protein
LAVVVVVAPAVVVVVGAAVVVVVGALVVVVVGALVVVVVVLDVLDVVVELVLVVVELVVVVTGGLQSPFSTTAAVFVACTWSGQVPCTLSVTVPACVPGRVVVALRLAPPLYSPVSPVTVPAVTVAVSTVIFWLLSEFFTVQLMTYWPAVQVAVPDTTG